MRAAKNTDLPSCRDDEVRPCCGTKSARKTRAFTSVAPATTLHLQSISYLPSSIIACMNNDSIPVDELRTIRRITQGHRNLHQSPQMRLELFNLISVHVIRQSNQPQQTTPKLLGVDFGPGATLVGTYLSPSAIGGRCRPVARPNAGEWNGSQTEQKPCR
jgi:hypothetical protein